MVLAETDELARPPVLCAGCPHMTSYLTMRNLGARVAGDIGCYTLAALDPLRAIDTTVSMGSGIGNAIGMALSGNEIKPVPSSFSAPVVLEETVAAEQYLDHDIRSVYLMESEEDISALRKLLDAGTIFRFDFSYRGGLEADAAFLLAGSDGNVFMTIGRAATTTYVGLQERAGLAVTAETADLDEDDMDFGVM